MLENKNIHDSYRAWVEISACQLNKNLQQIKNKIAPAAVFAVLKANAYGLNAVNIASCLNKNIIEGF